MKSNRVVSTLGSARSGRLRTVVCTRGGLFGSLVLRRLRACNHIEICAIVRSSRTFHPAFGFLRGALAYLRCSGVAYSLYLFCATTIADVLCSFARIDGARLRDAWRGVPVYTTRNINDADGLRFLRGCESDLIVSAFFDQRLRDAVLTLPAQGCLNIHPSLLPSFRGVDPVLQARLHGAADIGVTVHRMALAFDTGEILAQRTVAVRGRASIFATTAQLFDAGAELLVSEIDRVANGVTGTAQSENGSYQSWPTRRAVRAVHALGYPLLRLGEFVRLCLSYVPTAVVEPRTRELRHIDNTGIL